MITINSIELFLLRQGRRNGKLNFLASGFGRARVRNGVMAGTGTALLRLIRSHAARKRERAGQNNAESRGLEAGSGSDAAACPSGLRPADSFISKKEGKKKIPTDQDSLSFTEDQYFNISSADSSHSLNFGVFQATGRRISTASAAASVDLFLSGRASL